MVKRFNLENLDCANCAAKLERKVQGVKGIIRANVSFLAQKLIIEADEKEFDAIMAEVVKVAKKAVPDCIIKL